MMKSFENMSDEDLAGLDDSAFLEAGDETPAVQDQPQDQDPALEHQEDPIDPPVEDDGQKAEGEADAEGAEGDDKEGESPKVEDLSDADHDKQTLPSKTSPPRTASLHRPRRKSPLLLPISRLQRLTSLLKVSKSSTTRLNWAS